MNGIWIRADERPTESHFYYFTRKFTAGKENSLEIDVCADTRYQLYINGALCCEGPCQGSWYQRYYDTVDCSDKLHEGENDVCVKVYYAHDGAFISMFKKDREVEIGSSWNTLKNRIESHWNGFFSLSATFGRKWANRIPRVSGIPSRMNIVLNTSHKGMTKVGTSAATLAVWRYADGRQRHG